MIIDESKYINDNIKMANLAFLQNLKKYYLIVKYMYKLLLLIGAYNNSE